jgi:tRNA threonylcarbamoyladenosine biosynthesis protein TsaB
MTILALEFSMSQRSVALARGGRALAETSEVGERGANAFGMIEKVLATAKIGRKEIECLAVGLGPGSYTGIRVALSIAQGWQLATGVKLLGISSMECLAAQAQAEKIFGRVNVIVNAQRGEFYLTTYEISVTDLKEVESMKIAAAAEIEAHTDAGEILLGPEVTRWFPNGRIIFPNAATLSKLATNQASFMPGEKLEPIYLRETNFMKASPARMLS